MITLKELMDSGYSEEVARCLLKGDYEGARFQQIMDRGNPQEIKSLALEHRLKNIEKRMVDEVTKEIWAKAKSMNAKKSRP